MTKRFKKLALAKSEPTRLFLLYIVVVVFFFFRRYIYMRPWRAIRRIGFFLAWQRSAFSSTLKKTPFCTPAQWKH